MSRVPGMKRYSTIRRVFAIWIAIVFWAALPCAVAKSKPDSQKLRSEYISRAQQETALPQLVPTLGSLYIPGGAFNDMGADYKARRVGDVVTLLVVQQTAAQSAGDVNTQRTFQANSAITGAPGPLSSAPANPLIGMQSSKQLKGQGETSANSTVTARIAAQVIALLPNGNMVVEAERRTLINSQRETLIVRGVLRPGDVGPNNVAPSSALANLEIELKGKGVISDSINRPNLLVRGLLWLLTF